MPAVEALVETSQRNEGYTQGSPGGRVGGMGISCSGEQGSAQHNGVGLAYRDVNAVLELVEGRRCSDFVGWARRLRRKTQGLRGSKGPVFFDALD